LLSFFSFVFGLSGFFLPQFSFFSLYCLFIYFIPTSFLCHNI
jgi:hypothetical protein